MDDLQATEVELHNAANLCFEEFVKASLRILKLLNFELLDVSLTADQTPSEESPTSNDFLPIDKKPSNEQDFQILFSLEQVTRETLLKTKSEFVLPWAAQMSRELILLSEKHPLVSGFYRMLSIWYSRQRKAMLPAVKHDFDEDDDDEEESSMKEEVNGQKEEENVEMTDGKPKGANIRADVTAALFMQNLIGRIQHFSDEVLISALHLILDFPTNVVKDNLGN